MTTVQRGPNVAVVGADTSAGAELGAGLGELGASVAPIDVATLSGRGAVAAALDAAARQSGPIDGVIIASVGVGPTRRGAVANLDPDAWHDRVELPLKRTLVAFQGAFDSLRARGGTTVLLVPTLSLVGAAGFGPWAAVTEGQRALAKAAARAWGPDGVTVNCLAVPATLLRSSTTDEDDDDETPLDRPGQPAAALDRPAMREEVAAVVHTLLSRSWRSVTGATVAVDGGVWMAP